MKEQQTWKETIAAAIAAEDIAVPARDGLSPLTEMASLLEKLLPGEPNYEAAARALSDIINESDAREPAWDKLCQLIQLSKIQHPRIRDSLRSKLATDVIISPRDRISAMLTLTDLGVRFYPADLHDLQEELNEHPEGWIDIAARSECWPLIEETLPGLLEAGKLPAQRLILRLPAWWQWNPHWLENAVKNWIRAVPALEDREKISAWFKRRGLQVHSNEEPPSRLLPEEDRTFLSSACTYTPLATLVA